MPTRWHGSTSFTQEQRADIETSANWMADRLGKGSPSFTWDISDDSECTWCVVKGDLNGTKLAFATLEAKVIVDQAAAEANGLGREAYQHMFAHEFGHAHGMVHHGGPGIMDPGIDSSASLVWTLADYDVCVQLHDTHCDTPDEVGQ